MSRPSPEAPPARLRGVVRLVAVSGLVLLGVVAAAAGARAAAAPGERITRYGIAITAEADGSMRVREAIDYDFGSNERRGIERFLADEFDYDEGRVRRYPISDVQASSPSGAPAQVSESDEGGRTRIRIGDPDVTITGRHSYLLEYRVGGVMNTVGDRQELYWNVVGTQWSVPIEGVTVSLAGPAGVTEVLCFRGAQGSTDQCAARRGGGGATFSAPVLGPGQGMTVVAAFPPGTFPGAEPIIEERQTLARAFTLNPVTGLGSLAVLGLLGGGVAALASRRGRDEKYLGVIPGLEPGLGTGVGTRRVGLFRRDPVAVQFHPPKDVRVGQLGTLIDEQANVLDVTATIVDLAVRGFLRIEEVPKEGWFGSADWRLVMVDGANGTGLHGYELSLLQAIFSGRREVLLSQLKQTFSTDLQRVQAKLYDDVTLRGWFRGNPASVRLRWAVYGVIVIVAGVGLTWLLATSSRFGLVGVAVVVAGLVTVVLAPRMPARTARGTAVLAQTQGFRRYLETAEANQIRFEENDDVFSRYLPYAIVFGVAQRWAGVFDELARSGAPLPTPTWYSGSAFGHGTLHYAAFAGSMDSFTTTTSGSISAATPSSSGGSGFGGGGFSGGGGGGGGGGSW